MSCTGATIGRAVRGREQVVRGEHQDARLRLGVRRERDVHRHLVAVEVGVERVADERMDLDRLAVHQDRLERLDAQSVQRRRAVQQDRMLPDDLFQRVPYLRAHLVDHPLGRLDVAGIAALDQRLHDERLEQLQRHLLGQAALVQLQVRPDDDDGAAGVVDALAEQVLSEAALLALEHVGERLQRPVVGADDRAGCAVRCRSAHPRPPAAAASRG